MSSENSGTRTGGSDLFVGRSGELGQLLDCADRAGRGEPWLVVVEGEAGVGKSTLVSAFLARRPAATVLRATGERSLADTAYGALGQLLARMDHAVLGAYPLLSPDRRESPEPTAVGMQLLGLLGRLQDDGPVTVVVDDWQWIDKPSAVALGFALRRLWADRVLTVLLTRGAGPDSPPIATAEHSRRIRLVEFTRAEVADLVRAAHGPAVAAHVADRLFFYTKGHPLYVRTLLAELPVDALAGDGASFPVPASLRETIAGLFTRLPEAGRALVTALAVLGTRTTLATAGRLAAVAEPAAALSAALQAGLVDWWPSEPSTPVAMHHPVQRDAVYELIDPVVRHRMHRDAAELVPETSAWAHRVAATDGADDELARRLDEAGLREVYRDRYSLAAQLNLWAAEVSGTRRDRERRLLTASVLLGCDGEIARIQALKERVDQCAPSMLRDFAQAQMAMFGGDLSVEPVLRQVSQAAPEDLGPAWIHGLAVTYVAGFNGWVDRAPETYGFAKRALDLEALPGSIADMARYSLALGELHGRGARGALERLDALPTEQMGVAELSIRGMIRLAAGDLLAAVDDLSRSVAMINSGACYLTVKLPHAYLAVAYFLLGLWNDAAVAAEQGWAIATSRAQAYLYPQFHWAGALLAAGRGDFDEAVRQARAAAQLADVLGIPHERQMAAMAAAAHAQAAGDALAMRRAVRPLESMSLTVEAVVRYQFWGIPFLVEALIGTGELAAAERELRALESAADGVEYLRVVLGRLRGLLAHARGDTESALGILARAAAVPAGTEDPPLYRAMLEHDYGRLLAAAGKPGAVRWLRSAAARFEALDARAFLARCREDLERTHEGAQPHGAASARTSLAALTQRELQVADLVGRGMTNVEIGAALFVTDKTVEYHLGHIYTKLDLRNRRELRDLVQHHDGPVAAAR